MGTLVLWTHRMSAWVFLLNAISSEPESGPLFLENLYCTSVSWVTFSVKFSIGLYIGITDMGAGQTLVSGNGVHLGLVNVFNTNWYRTHIWILKLSRVTFSRVDTVISVKLVFQSAVQGKMWYCEEFMLSTSVQRANPMSRTSNQQEDGLYPWITAGSLPYQAFLWLGLHAHSIPDRPTSSHPGLGLRWYEEFTCIFISRFPITNIPIYASKLNIEIFAKRTTHGPQNPTINSRRCLHSSVFQHIPDISSRLLLKEYVVYQYQHKNWMLECSKCW